MVREREALYGNLPMMTMVSGKADNTKLPMVQATEKQKYQNTSHYTCIYNIYNYVYNLLHEEEIYKQV